MKTSTILLNEQKLIEKAVNVLFDKLGPVETQRFLAITFHNRLDSVKRHHQWQSKLNKEKFFAEVFKS